MSPSLRAILLIGVIAVAAALSWRFLPEFNKPRTAAAPAASPVAVPG